MYKQNFEIKDEVIIEHRDRNGKLIKRHKLNSGLVHKFLVKLSLAHNSITAVGFKDIGDWISGLAAPVAYTYIGIGTGTTADNVDQTALQTALQLTTVTPTHYQTTKANDTVQWTHVFSKANDAAGCTGTGSAINEVAITSDDETYHMLIHIAGGTNYGAVDNCNWDAGDTLSVTINCQIKQGS